jgi:hypothetical protein
MQETLKEGLRLLRIYTAGSCNVWDLMGGAKASVRAHVMAALLGVVKIPQAKAGVNALRAEFYRQAKIEGDCEATRETRFITLARSAV